MKSRGLSLELAILVMIFAATVRGHAQEILPKPAPQPTPPITESQERVKVFTEEVVLPVTLTTIADT